MEAQSKPPRRRSLMLGNFVHSETREQLGFLLDAAIAVDERGKIVDMDNGSDDVKTAKKQLLCRLGWDEHDLDVYACRRGQFFFPGFVDTHVHAAQYPIVGVFGETSLLDWLDKHVFPCEQRFADDKVARQVYTACVRRTLAHGTTTAAYYATTHVAATKSLADICLGLGQRAFIGRVCMDRDLGPAALRDPSTRESLERSDEVTRYINGRDAQDRLVRPILTPRFALSCTRKVMSGLDERHREHELPIQTHMSESPREVEDVARLYPEAGSYAKVYDEHGLLTASTILGHCIHLSEGEARLVGERRAKVSHCPCSNSALGSGEARPFDPGGGQAGGPRQQTPGDEGPGRGGAQTGQPLGRAGLVSGHERYLATRGGAKVVGLEHTVGGFQVGMDWDAQLVGLHVVGGGGEGEHKDSGNVDLFEWDLCNWKTIVAKWVYNGDDRNTKMVWVKGRRVHKR
ncbi:guanine deaminase [Metarhizium album ARSEF 1941]|uniref:Guanine deaminase n=1 Tax=Metarhizium album (strain ARSEF 1941) TaxID=1081103 RepID=A0A0B2WX48_METAS|nr:guanine deaminase [Metarhizium album ARSEF 1941]KHO00787.1 guanine deaminase [Metarhizium album ARSEF 1941]